MNINKFLYKKWYFGYFCLSYLRMAFYTFSNQREKSIRIITEHFNW